MSHTKDRIFRMNEIEKIYFTAKKRERDLDEEKVIASCCLKWGCSRRIMKEYIKQLKILGKI